MDVAQLLLQSVVLAIVAGIVSQVLAEKIQMPSIVVLMVFGILLGPQVLNLIQPELMGPGLEVLVSLAVALILFEGGLSLDMESFKEVNQSVRNMVTFGMIITVLGSAVVIHYLLGASWLMSFLFGGFMSITGLTVINPILQRVHVKNNVATILKSEGILSNPIGAFISVVILEIILTAHHSFAFFLKMFFIKLVAGTIFGFVMGWLLGKLLKKKYFSDDIKNLVVLAWVFGTYWGSNMIVANTGILSVVFAGFAVQRENLTQFKTLKRFKGQLSILFISLLFILISANLELKHIINLGSTGLTVVAILMLVVRPISTFISNIGILSFKEKLFVSWIGPKGIVSASVASLFSLILTKNGFEGAQLVESLVYLTILITVVFQGLTARPVARYCKVLLESGGVLIIGANALGRTLGTAFKEIGKDVILVDNNLDHCKDASLDKLSTVYGNALDPAILEMAQMSNAEVLIATTANSEVNFIVSQMAKEEYHVPQVYPAIDNPEKGVHHKLVDEIGGNLAFAKTVSIEDWKLAISKSQVKIVEWELTDNKGGLLCDLEPSGINPDDWLPLILKRDDQYFFAHSDQVWNQGDVLISLSKS